MAQPLKSIVIGTSLTQGSDDVVRSGVALARATGASLWLIHAYSPLFIASGAGVDALWTAEQVKGLQELITEQARRTGLTELASFSPDRVLLELGAPHREIVALAQRVRADLIVVGAAETPGILGSTADRVIRKAPCPVLALRTPAAFPPTRVEIPVDLSASSAHALRYGLDVLAQIGLSSPEAEVLFVLNPFEVGGSIHFSPEQVRRFAAEELQRFLTANLTESVRPHLATVRTGYAREEILAALHERNVDLAILGTHGRSGFERLVIGSVAAGVLRGAGCNLLVVPPGAAGLEEVEAREETEGADWSYVSDERQSAAGAA